MKSVPELSENCNGGKIPNSDRDREKTAENTSIPVTKTIPKAQRRAGQVPGDQLDIQTEKGFSKLHNQAPQQPGLESVTWENDRKEHFNFM